MPLVLYLLPACSIGSLAERRIVWSQTHHELPSPLTHLLGCCLPQWVSLLLLACHSPIRSPTNPFQILLPVWNLGGKATSSICCILGTSLSWESICCSEKNPWARHFFQHVMGSNYFSLLSWHIYIVRGKGNSQLVSICSVPSATLGTLFTICISFNCYHKPAQQAISPLQRRESWVQRS